MRPAGTRVRKKCNPRFGRHMSRLRASAIFVINRRRVICDLPVINRRLLCNPTYPRSRRKVTPALSVAKVGTAKEVRREGGRVVKSEEAR